MSFLDKAFSALEAAAAKGERCPQNSPDGIISDDISELARLGRVRSEIFAHNWRVVTILTGPHAGKKTAPCPHKCHGAWRVTDHEGTHYPRQDARLRALTKGERP